MDLLRYTMQLIFFFELESKFLLKILTLYNLFLKKLS